MREVVLDTETTGFNPDEGDRIVEIGCVELINHIPTGRTYQQYVNPERSMPPGAFAVHGLSDAFLADKPIFALVVEEFLAFIQDSQLVIHNASFDLKFLNAELKRLQRKPIAWKRAVDTVEVARKKFPGAPANLDALCRRFEIDLSDRELHGALKDSHLLAAVYLELLGGRQPGLVLAKTVHDTDVTRTYKRVPRLVQPTPEEAALHEAFIDRLKDPLWRKLL
ncbi:MAG: DNA polymerase III subunit epsilon [Rhodospirillales bacterium]|nr:DNA polymerase III subunit epsilon [Rhodospirillales bacterium]